MTVADWMSRDPITFRPDQPLLEVEEVLVGKRVTGAPVVEGGRVVGVISRSDLVRQLELERSRVGYANEMLEPYDRDDAVPSLVAMTTAVATRWVGLRVSDAMRRDVETIEPAASLAEAARRMVERRIHRLIVIEGDRLVGTLSTLDVLRSVAEGDQAPASPPASVGSDAHAE